MGDEGKRYGKWRKILVWGFWLLVAAGGTTLLVAAIRHQNRALCKSVRIEISGTGRRMVDSAELEAILTDQHTRHLVGTPSGSISIRRLEKRIGDNPWVKKADLFFDSKQVLWVKVIEREPVARLFTQEGSSFYVDLDGARLPLKDYFPVPLPVFTSCPLDKRNWNGPDTALAREIAALSVYLQGHPFWMNMVQQVDVNDARQFELVPAVGDYVLRIGDTSDLDRKFTRLKVFYERVIPRVGWNKYAVVDARYTGEIIGVRRDAQSASIDTAKAAALLKDLIEQGRTAMRDTVVRAAPVPREPVPDIDSTRSLVPDEGAGAAAAASGAAHSATKPAAGAPKPGSGGQKPKAVLPPKKKK
ncbi:cell division protein FtsQ/DivIB [Dinghuibacter silviterrae]|uniref:Cell division protein FtsQ n=1 Tax=Dinghuibacter silviterrae TaxID=1539049 RepID=A0A4R8DQ37_9BACT|nr:cell division protein FtsQ/DivIB [Dinghuibacter silviterrae]TDX00250.1 cell division protein FtsQ [Dinghuibacter silviterrae]